VQIWDKYRRNIGIVGWIAGSIDAGAALQQFSLMETVGDSEYHAKLAQAARQRADVSGDADLARRLRETAVKHERMARRLRRLAEPRSFR